jgi:release factor glutamine methyltransferase
VNVRESIHVAVDALGSKLEAEQLVCHVLGVNRAFLLAHPEAEVPELALRHALQRRVNGEPLSYILGRREFYGRDFIVTPDVLIPRHETENVLDAALERLPRGGLGVDVGTGSGCIAITMALARQDAMIVGTDISDRALRVASLNASNHGAEVNFCQSDLLDPFSFAQFDLVVSNPPYVAEGYPLAREVRDFEPSVALFGGHDGLAVIRRLVAQSAQIKKGGWLVMEIGFDQGSVVAAILTGTGMQDVAILPDAFGRDRIAVARR